MEIAFVAGSGVTGTVLFLAIWHLSGFVRRRKRGEADDASVGAPADQDEDARAQTGRAGVEALDALAANVAAIETRLSDYASGAGDIPAELDARRREISDLREEMARLGACCAELEAGAAAGAADQARLQAEAETAADRLAALDAYDLPSVVDAAVQARVGAALEGFDPAGAAEAQARADARLEALEGADPTAAYAPALEARIVSVAERMSERFAALEASAPAQAEATARAVMGAALEDLKRRLAAVERLDSVADVSQRVETAMEGVSARLGALEAGAAARAGAEAAFGRIEAALEGVAARLAALEAVEPAADVEAEVRTGVEKAMGPAMARVAALRGEVEAAVEARLAPLLSRLGALEEERMVLRRTVNLPAPKAVAGLRVEMDALADRLSTLAAARVGGEESPAAAKPRVTMLSSTKI